MRVIGSIGGAGSHVWAAARPVEEAAAAAARCLFGTHSPLLRRRLEEQRSWNADRLSASVVPPSSGSASASRGGILAIVARRMAHSRPGAIVTTNTTLPIFHSESNAVFQIIQDRLEAADMDPDIDVTLADDILSVRSRKFGVWVLNKHSVTRQIWLSSPLSGPNKYNYHSDTATWLGERDQHRLHDRLAKEFRRFLVTPHAGPPGAAAAYTFSRSF